MILRVLPFLADPAFGIYAILLDHRVNEAETSPIIDIRVPNCIKQVRKLGEVVGTTANN